MMFEINRFFANRDSKSIFVEFRKIGVQSCSSREEKSIRNYIRRCKIVRWHSLDGAAGYFWRTSDSTCRTISSSDRNVIIIREPSRASSHVRSWSLRRIYAARLIGNHAESRLPRAERTLWTAGSLPIARKCETIKRGAVELQLNKVIERACVRACVCAAQRPRLSPHNGRLDAAIIFYIRLASFQLTPAYGRQRLRGYRRHGPCPISNVIIILIPWARGEVPRTRAAKIFSIAVISIAKAPFLASDNPSRRCVPPRHWKMRYISRALGAWRERSNRFRG